ncbi:MFS transporter [Methylocapsa sp. S129]|uniref:MFS transporter n=1 Tax=Methylocapsa sp. S129 TaxID=1641869 RepID=UPI00131DC0EB|nr:MFS transporter [Methylocapsa sp. S129]
MFAQALAQRLSRYGVHYGWVVIGVTFLTALTTAGAVGVPGALILPLTKEFGWDTAQISSALAIRLVLFGLMGPFAAALIERYGVRRIVLSAISLIVVGLLLALIMSQAWHLIVLWGLVVGVGTGLTAMVLNAIVATRWFTHRRGLVLGMLTASSATGQLVFLPLAAWLVEHIGWRYALAPSVIGLLIAGVLVTLFMCDRPSDVGLAPYGEAAPAPGQSLTAPPPAAAFGRAFSVLSEISTSRTFWILFATFFICGLSTNGLVQTHFISLCADYGMPAVAAASTLAMMGVFDFFGTIASGWLSDRYDNRALLFWYYGLRGLSLLYLPYSTFTFYGLSLFGAFYGLDWIATVPPTVRLSAQAFGKERAGIAFGWIFAAHQLGAATAAFGAGLSRSILLSYLPAFFAAGAMCLVASAIVWLIRLNPAARSASA